MHDSHSTPAGTDAALRDASRTVYDAISDLGLAPQASVAEVVRRIPRLLTDAAVAATTGNQADTHTLLLALLSIRRDARQISDIAEATIQQLLADHPELAAHHQWAEDQLAEHDAGRLATRGHSG